MVQKIIDASELREFAADMRRYPEQLRPHIRPVVEKGAVKIKKQMRDEMSASPHFKGVTRSITYDIIDRVGGVEAEIGPLPGAPGSLANIAYFGGSRGGGGVPDPRGALEAEVPAFERALGALIDKVLR